MKKFFIFILIFWFTSLLAKQKVDPKSKDILKPQREKLPARPISVEEVKQDLKMASARFNKYELAFESAFKSYKYTYTGSGTSVSSDGSISTFDLSVFFLLGGYVEPGFGVSYSKSSIEEIVNYHIRCIVNFLDIKFNRSVPYMLLGFGYSDVNNIAAEERFTGYYLPEAKLGVKYFIKSNIALNVDYMYSLRSLKSTTVSSNKYKLRDSGFQFGLSLFL